MRDNKVIKYKNKIEVRILVRVYLVIFIPLLTILTVNIMNKGFNEMRFYFFMFLLYILLFICILFIINRFCITLDYEKRQIRYTSYFRKTKIYPFSDIKIYYCKGKTTLIDDYVFNFLCNNNVLFKISSIDFEGQTKRSVELLKEFFSGHQKCIYELEKEIKIPNGNFNVITYELEEAIAVAYLPKGITIDLGYVKSEQRFYLTVYNDENWDNQLEVVEASEIEDIKDLLQDLINKYSE